MVRIAICDDDENQFEYMAGVLNEWSDSRGRNIYVYVYGSAEEFLFEYPEKPCDLLLLDIEMEKMNGMELAKKLREKGDMLPIIFITGYSDYIGEGYDVQALHYLLKPLDKQKLFEVLDRYAKNTSDEGDVILVMDESSVHVSIDDIMFVESFGKKSEVHLSDESVKSVLMSISEFENPHGFIYTHRSYIVNLRYVKTIGKTSVTLDNGTEIPLSRRRYNDVTRKFIDYYKGENR